MPIVGTAGHVDHGKSTLVKALTGRDPDRWAEEKERGLTIDLGFAWAEIDGIDVGFVDVPGHERFIKNMLAGIGAIDCALLVVAADSGWMPQTEEHASVLDLLAVPSGIIALTRVDLVDEDTIELATLEIMDEIEGTTLAEWPIVPVSAVTGIGLDVLTETIAATLRASAASGDGQLKMWIDRAFTVSGAGVVVTGTISRGSIAIGDEIEILPDGLIDRVRGLHHHDTAVEASTYGQRTAINLQSVGLDDVARGSLVVAPNSITTTSRLLALLTPARQFAEIPQRGAFHLHIGSAHTPVTIRRLFGTETYLMTLDSRMPMVMGDRFILRDSGRQAVVGGGRVVDSQAPQSTSVDDILTLTTVVDGTPVEKANALVSVRRIADLDDIRKASGGGVPTIGLTMSTIVLSPEAVSDITEKCVAIVETYHKDYPLRPGIPKAELATQIGVDLRVIDAIVQDCETLDQSDGAVHAPGESSAFTATQGAAWERVRGELEGSFDVPRMTAIEIDVEILHALIRSGELVQIAPDLVFTRTQVGEIHERLSNLEDGFSVTEFKEAFGMTRRQAIPTLEWLDTSGWTRRDGDGRTVRRRDG